LTLRSIGASDGIAMTASAGRAEAAGIKPVWAGDVSPALDQIAFPNKASTGEPQRVEVIRGTKIATVKLQ